MTDELRKRAKVLEDEAFALLRRVTALEADNDRLRAERMPAEATDAMCEAAVAVIRKAMAGEGAPFDFPDAEHAYDIYAAMRRAALEGRTDD